LSYQFKENGPSGASKQELVVRCEKHGVSCYETWQRKSNTTLSVPPAGKIFNIKFPRNSAKKENDMFSILECILEHDRQTRDYMDMDLLKMETAMNMEYFLGNIRANESTLSPMANHDDMSLVSTVLHAWRKDGEIRDTSLVAKMISDHITHAWGSNKADLLMLRIVCCMLNIDMSYFTTDEGTLCFTRMPATSDEEKYTREFVDQCGSYDGKSPASIFLLRCKGGDKKVRHVLLTPEEPLTRTESDSVQKIDTRDVGNIADFIFDIDKNYLRYEHVF
jgi:hypothetical protein